MQKVNLTPGYVNGPWEITRDFWVALDGIGAAFEGRGEMSIWVIVQYVSICKGGVITIPESASLDYSSYETDGLRYR